MDMNNQLTEEQINYYQENGFVQVDGILNEDELEELREYVDEVMEVENGISLQKPKDGGYYKVLNQRVNAWRDHGGICKYDFHPGLAEMARKLMGSDGVRFFHDHVLYKMPGDRNITPWHQDSPAWPMSEDGALSIWIALDDVDETNGCMQFIPKSRNVGKRVGNDFVNPQSFSEYAEGTDLKEDTAVICRVKAGGATFHDGLTFHYAFANETDKPRRVLAIIYMPDGTTFGGRKSHHVLKGMEFKEGEPLRGRMFPLLVKV